MLHTLTEKVRRWVTLRTGMWSAIGGGGGVQDRRKQIEVSNNESSLPH